MQMRKQLIMKSQKNQIFEQIKHTKLNPSEFEWIECDSDMVPGLRVSKLIHRPTDSYCMFDFSGTSRWTAYSPGDESAIERKESHYWFDQSGHVVTWLVSLSREFKSPDLWATISQETKLAEVASSSNITNEPFSSKEQSYILTQLHEVKEYLITTQKHAKEQEEFVTKRFDYLEGATKRLGRQDWLTMVIGVLLTIVIRIGLDANVARELFQLVANSLSRLWGGTPLLP